MAQQEEIKLPEGWEVLNFSKELTQIPTTNKKIAAKSYLPSGNYPVIDQGQDFIAGYCDDVDRLITIEKPVVVFGDHTRAIKFVDFDFVPGADGTKVLLANDYFDPKYFYYMLRVIELPDKGYSRHFKYLKEANSLVAPLPEQKRIVEKLDSLLAQVDTIQQRLNNLPDIIKRFRQSVLASAVSGKLTEQWRENNREFSNWEDVILSNITKSISDGDHQAPPKAESGIPFLVISNVRTGDVNFDNVSRWVPESYYDSLKDIRVPKVDDILYTVTGSFGIPVQVKTDEKFCFQRHIAIIKPNEEHTSSRFLYHLLNSDFALIQAEATATGTAQKTVSLKSLRGFKFNIPQLEEQTEIVRLVEQYFALADTLEKNLANAKQRVDNLTQSILAKAFKGELVPQDPNDEPADKLLERIKVARLEAEKLEKAAKKAAKASKAKK